MKINIPKQTDALQFQFAVDFFFFLNVYKLPLEAATCFFY